MVNLTELGVSMTPPGGGPGRLERGPRRQFLRQRYHLIRSWFGDTQAQVQWDLDVGQLSRAEASAGS